MANKQKTAWEIRKDNRVSIWKKLSPEQKEALRDLQTAWEEMQSSYRELCHPQFGDIVKMDDAYYRLRNVLIEE
jgi:hypothetical protein